MKYSKHLPEKLRDLINKKLLETMDSNSLKEKYEQNISSEVGIFLRKNYSVELRNKQLKTVSKDVIINAISRGAEHPNTGFVTKTADVLCLYATDGEMDWAAFLKNHPELEKDYKIEEKSTKTQKPDFPIVPNPTIESASKKIIEKIDDYIPSLNNSEDIKIEEKLEEYLNRNKKLFEHISLPFAKNLTSIPIEKLVPPNVTRINDTTNLDKVNWYNNYEWLEKAGIKMQINQNIFEALEYSDRLLLVADGGLGKSSLCKWLFCNLSRNFIENRNNTFPIFLELKSIQSIRSKIEYELCSYDEIGSLLRNYTPVFILDGLDEMTSSSHHIIQEIKDLEVQFTDRCKILITSREHDYTKDFVNIGYDKYKLEGIDKEYLSKELISNENERLSFEKFCVSIDLEKEVVDNPFFYTCMVLLFKKRLRDTAKLSKGKLLQLIIEDNYMENWEMSDIGFRETFRKEFVQTITLTRALSLLALFHENYTYLCTDQKWGDYFFLEKKVFSQNGITIECFYNIISISFNLSDKIKNSLVHFFIDSGIIAINKLGYIYWGNKIIREYFLSRAYQLSIFDIELPLIPVEFRTKIRNHFLETYNERFFDITVGLLISPDSQVEQILKKIQVENEAIQGSYSADFIKELILCAKIIGLRKNQLNEETIKKFTTGVMSSYVRSKNDELSKNCSTILNEDVFYMIFAFCQEECFLNIFFEMYKNKTDDISINWAWNFFNKFPNCSFIVEHSLITLKMESSNRDRNLLKEDACMSFIINYHIGSYFELVVNSYTSTNLFGTVFHERFIGYRKFEFWKHIQTKMKSRIPDQGVRYFCQKLRESIEIDIVNIPKHTEVLIKTCPKDVFSIFFLKPWMEGIKSSLTDDEISKYISFLNTRLEGTFEQTDIDIHESTLKTILDKVVNLRISFPFWLIGSQPFNNYILDGWFSNDSYRLIFSTNYSIWVPKELFSRDHCKRILHLFFKGNFRNRVNIIKVLIHIDRDQFFKHILWKCFGSENITSSASIGFQYLLKKNMSIYAFLNKSSFIFETLSRKMHFNYARIKKDGQEKWDSLEELVFFAQFGTENSIEFLYQFQEQLSSEGNEIVLGRVKITIQEILIRAKRFKMYYRENSEKVDSFVSSIDLYISKGQNEKPSYLDEGFGIFWY